MALRCYRYCVVFPVTAGWLIWLSAVAPGVAAADSADAKPAAEQAAEAAQPSQQSASATSAAKETPASQAGVEAWRSTTVGMPAQIDDLILPGSQLEVAKLDRDAPLVLRMIQSMGHGTDQFRYQLEYYCLEPGEYNLSDYLQRVDGSSADDLPELAVLVRSQLPAGQVKPHELLQRSTPRPGGYETWLWVGGIAWVLGLLGLLLSGRKQETAEERAARAQTFEERLRPLVEQAAKGQLSEAQQAELERMLLTYWRGKLDLNNVDAGEAMRQLREHEQAGELLRQMETWLHMPPERRQDIDVAAVMEPYRGVGANA